RRPPTRSEDRHDRAQTQGPVRGDARRRGRRRPRARPHAALLAEIFAAIARTPLHRSAPARPPRWCPWPRRGRRWSRKMTTFAQTAPTVGKLVRLLGSDKDHEALGAARALKRVLTSVKLDLHDLANVVEFAAHREIPQVEATTDNPFSRMRRSDVRAMLRVCHDY